MQYLWGSCLVAMFRGYIDMGFPDVKLLKQKMTTFIFVMPGCFSCWMKTLLIFKNMGQMLVPLFSPTKTMTWPLSFIVQNHRKSFIIQLFTNFDSGWNRWKFGTPSCGYYYSLIFQFHVMFIWPTMGYCVSDYRILVMLKHSSEGWQSW